MNRDRYDPVNKKCLDCGILMPNRDIDIKEHTCNPYDIERKLKKLFGAREPRERPLFKKGQSVEGQLIGEIKDIITTRNGEVMYKIEDEERNVHGFFLQSQVLPLLTPELLQKEG